MLEKGDSEIIAWGVVEGGIILFVVLLVASVVILPIILSAIF